MTENSDAVASHYNTFPFPKIKQFVVPQPSRFKGDSLNFLLRRRRKNWLKQDIKIWIAGCGTQQAAHWAMCFPKAEIIATDISETTLEIAKSLTSQLEINNVTFYQKDLMQHHYKNEFDLVVSTGVLHHLPTPEIGLGNIKIALKENGAGFLMLYSKMHREPLQVFRNALNLLTLKNENSSDRYQLAGAILEEFQRSKKFQPLLSSVLDKLLELYKTDASSFADALLQPVESSYNVDELFNLLHYSGFRHAAWLQEQMWDLQAYTSNMILLQRFAKLDDVAKYKVIYNLAAYASPIFTFFVEHNEMKQLPPYSRCEILDMPILFNSNNKVMYFESDKLSKTSRYSTYNLDEEKLKGNSSELLGANSSWELPARAKLILDACNGEYTVGELMSFYKDEFSEEAIFKMLSQFLPNQLGLATPSWD